MKKMTFGLAAFMVMPVFATSLVAILACGAVNSWFVTSAAADDGRRLSLMQCPEGCSGHLCSSGTGTCYCTTESDGTRYCLRNPTTIPVEP